jgi:hypothetical protein
MLIIQYFVFNELIILNFRDLYININIEIIKRGETLPINFIIGEENNIELIYKR